VTLFSISIRYFSANLLELAEEMFSSKVHYITTNIESARKMRKAGMIPVVDGIIPGTTGTACLFTY
jgi:hypothetical protein